MMGSHSKPIDRRVSVTKVAGLAGMAAAAATMAMSVGAGTAEAKPSTTPVKPNVTAQAPKAAATTSPVQGLLNVLKVPVYNPGPLTIGSLPCPSGSTCSGFPGNTAGGGGVVVAPPVPGTQPFAKYTFQLPFWTINPTTGKPVVPF